MLEINRFERKISDNEQGIFEHKKYVKEDGIWKHELYNNTRMKIKFNPFVGFLINEVGIPCYFKTVILKYLEYIKTICFGKDVKQQIVKILNEFDPNYWKGFVSPFLIDNYHLVTKDEYLTFSNDSRNLPINIHPR